MASELVLVVSCDVCGVKPATQHALTLDGRSWGIDLCPDHDGPLAGVTGLVEASGRPDTKRAKPGNQVPASGMASGHDPQLAARFRTCPVCGYESPTRQALSTHVRHHHDLALAAYEREHGIKHACPRCHVTTGSFMTLSNHSAREGHSLAEGGR